MMDLTPNTFGIPSISTLKLQLKVSSSVVSLKSFSITILGSAERFKSIVSFKPERSVSSRTSEISLILPCLTASSILSIIASIVVV